MTHQKLLNSQFIKKLIKKDIPDFSPGSEVAVHYTIKEGDKERVQVFKGVVISKKNGTAHNATFTVLRNSTANVKVERTFPLHSPYIEKIVVTSHQRGKQSKLYFLKSLKNPILRKPKPIKAR